VGQAKQRGSKEDRVQQVKAKLDAIRPLKLTCNACGTDITEIKDMPTKGLPGIEGIFIGKCPKCGDMTQAVAGDKDAVAAYNAFMDQHLKNLAHQHPPKLPRMNIQSKRGEVITTELSESDIRKSNEISESANLLGYTIFLPNQNEYLTSIVKKEDGSSERNYDADINNAQVFNTYIAAKKASKLLIQDGEVCLLFEDGKKRQAYSS